MNMNSPVAEIVTFRLTPDTTPEDLTAAARAMAPFLAATGAVTARVLSIDADGLWTDHLVWTSMEAAKSAAQQVMTEPAAQPFLAMIDRDSVTMRHAPVTLSH